MKKAFIYVGHSNWGKSFALKQVTNGNSHKMTIQINGQWVWVRKMSNDDQPDELLDFVDSIPTSWYHYFILAFCPNHDSNQLSMDILTSLQSSCQLFFFVQESKFTDASRIIPASEIAFLESIGTVQILSGQHIDTVRASEFLDFIRPNI